MNADAPACAMPSGAPPPRAMSHGSRREAGLALVFTLWGLALLGLMAAAFLDGMRTEIRVITNIAAAAEAEALADGAVHRAIHGLLAPAPARPFRTDGTAVTWRLPAGDVMLRVQDEGGKVDLNGADGARLVRLLQAVGAEPAEAAVLALRILDFRDRDSLARDGGDEASALPPGLPPPANRPFRSVDELAEVTGIGRDLAARLAPHVTVGPFARSVDPMVATRAALLAQPGVDPAEADAFLASRAEATATPPRGPAYATSPANRFTIRAVARAASGAVFAREALVILDPDAPLGHRIEGWRRSDAGSTEAPRP